MTRRPTTGRQHPQGQLSRLEAPSPQAPPGAHDGHAGTERWRGLDVEERSQVPYTDKVTEQLIERAVCSLAARRCPAGADDPAARVSCLLSLAVEADSQLYDAVADAVEDGYSWDQIAWRLNLTARSARRRYRPYQTWREKGCPWPIS